MSGSTKFSKIRTRRARCNQVLVILNNRLETVKLIREEIHPPIGDLAVGPLELAVMSWHGLEIRVALECVVFLSKLPPEPQWIEEAHSKIEKELSRKFRASVRRADRAD
ncbi:MAG: hypothetical protein ACREIC_00660 [Limisphaerales bacterium]